MHADHMFHTVCHSGCTYLFHLLLQEALALVVLDTKMVAAIAGFPLLQWEDELQYLELRVLASF